MARWFFAGCYATATLIGLAWSADRIGRLESRLVGVQEEQARAAATAARALAAADRAAEESRAADRNWWSFRSELDGVLGVRSRAEAGPSITIPPAPGIEPTPAAPAEPELELPPLIGSAVGPQPHPGGPTP